LGRTDYRRRAVRAGGIILTSLAARASIAATKSRVQTMFIVQGKPRSPEGIIKVIKATRAEALAAADLFLTEGMPFVTVVADGRVYTVTEFAETMNIELPDRLARTASSS
jgi:hypothetical protein